MTCEIDANSIHFDDLKTGMRDNTYEQCPECLKYLIWDKIPHENILTYDEYHGDKYQRPETQVVGFLCPCCTAKNDF